MKRNKLLLLTLFAALRFCLSAQAVSASEFNFSVEPIIPENQIDKSKTYFDLKMSQGQEQVLEVNLRNDTPNDVVIENTINSATTNLNGVVEYGVNKIKPDSSLKHNLKELGQVEREVTIKKQSKLTLQIKVTMPNEAFDGVIAGGITFKEKEAPEKQEDNDGKGLAIKNEYSYVVAILMHQTDTVVNPDLRLTDVAAGQVNARNVINVSLQNYQSAYLNQLRLINSVTRKGDSKVLYSSSAGGMQVAPNSHFSYPISLNGEKLKGGKYHLKSIAYGNKSDDGQYEVKNEKGETERYRDKWEFDKDFTIFEATAKRLNAKDVTIEDNNWWIYILIGILLLLVALLLILLLYRRKKKEDESRQRRNRHDAKRER
ncbi:MAG: DUF916 and DUF3324 domain-containing protein [Streptococcaceae bacterium]|jgi:LPXTG-motif cell wall-anchored protein|nr:DUF916 and DUF3324 domain-containing protein [Streptococcaceae bacterium]